MKKSKKPAKSQQKKDTSKKADLNTSEPLINSNKSPKKEESETRSFTIDMPDVKDIPGQEHIRVPHLRGLNDITISSDDEEGKGIWEQEEEP